jgi:ribosomal protein S18 acetylase RimI-like enzyme
MDSMSDAAYPRPVAAPPVFAVRPARLPECAAIAALAQELLPEAWSEPQLSSEIALPEGRVWVARNDGGLLGFLVARRELDELHVLLTGVAPAARRRGVGSRLLHALLAAEGGIAQAHLEVREGNRGAQSFYASLGFEAVGRRPRHYPNGEAALLMTRPAR